MRKTSIVAAVAAAWALPVAAQAQDATSAPQTQGTTADTTAVPAAALTAPDGTRAFGIVPYVGVMGGWENFDNEPNYGIPQAFNANGSRRTNYHLSGALVQGVVGVNVPLGPLFVGVEGNVAKGVSGNIDWEYGAAGRFGVRAGDSGMVYGKVGYKWIQFDHFGSITPGADTGRKYQDATYGIGVEVGPKDIGLKGLTNNAGIRIRAEVDTYGAFHSIQPMLGLITHF